MMAAGWSWPAGEHHGDYSYCGNDSAFCAHFSGDEVFSVQFTASGSGTVRIKYENAFTGGDVTLLRNSAIVSSAAAQTVVDQLYSFEDGDVFRLEERNTAVLKIYPSMDFTCAGSGNIA